MFVEAIENAAQYTRAIHSIIRTYGGKKIIPGAGTLFFVNDEGFAVTCKHVAEILITADKLNKQWLDFKAARNKLRADGSYKQNLKGLELKFNYTLSSIIQVKNNFVDCVDGLSGFTAHLHPKYDLAILKFNDYGALRYQKHAVFLKDSSSIRQGEFLCRLGFPFPEFSNYVFNEAADDIEWSKEGIIASPRFLSKEWSPVFLGMKAKCMASNSVLPGLKDTAADHYSTRRALYTVCNFQQNIFTWDLTLLTKRSYPATRQKKCLIIRSCTWDRVFMLMLSRNF